MYKTSSDFSRCGSDWVVAVQGIDCIRHRGVNGWILRFRGKQRMPSKVVLISCQLSPDRAMPDHPSKQLTFNSHICIPFRSPSGDHPYPHCPHVPALPTPAPFCPLSHFPAPLAFLSPELFTRSFALPWKMCSHPAGPSV